ncbi:TetR/AcrR family transcriptional regulator [Actinosynnema sp. NPDC020468]|uniref:TetR/AcrR family transcriptional regulator n=1 Tax=Actinosynnema sp. NPDC020468 TaxID=3154488 RepID=UPI0033D828D8
MSDVEPPWWTPRKTTTRRSLSREAIVDAALKLLRAEGVEGLSMRRVAGELGTGQASLYAHVANKDELLELLFDRVVADVPLPEPDPQRWYEQTFELWTAAHAALLRNGDIARVALARVPLGPNALRLSETAMTIMLGGGVPPRAAAWALDVVGLFVSASAVEDAIGAELNKRGRDPGEYYAAVAGYFADLPAERFPRLVEHSAELASGERDARFRFGLSMLLAGLAAQARRD